MWASSLDSKLSHSSPHLSLSASPTQVGGPRLCPVAGPKPGAWPAQKPRVPVAPLRASWLRTKGSNLSLWLTLGPLPEDLAKRVSVGHLGCDQSPCLPFHVSPNPNTPSSVQPSWTSGGMSPFLSVLRSHGVLPLSSHSVLHTSAPSWRPGR